MGNACKGANDSVPQEIANHKPEGHHLMENLRLGKTQSHRDYAAHYKVIKDVPLGVGLHGPVYKAIHRESGDVYANKFLSTHGVPDENINMLKNELTIMSSLNHPHIAELVDVYEVSSGIHMIEEICTGGELHSRMAEKGGFSEADARVHIRVMVDVMRYMHDKKIVHNDLKLENWLFENESNGALLKLIDFGFSKQLGSEKLMGAQGSTMYMAPEVFTGNYDMQCDMWSIGVIAFMMMTSVPPFLRLGDDGCVDFNGTRKLVMSGGFSYPAKPELSPEAKDFIGKLLVVDPQQRFTAVEAQKHTWLRQDQEVANLDVDIIQRLEEFPKKTKLQQTVLQVLAYLLTPAQIGQLRVEFMKLDRAATEEKCVPDDDSNKVMCYHTGEVSYEQFASCMKAADADTDETRLKEVFKSLDFDNAGIIHWNEFLAATMNYAVLSEKELQKAFNRLDCDNSGYITFDNLKNLVGEDLTEQQLREMLADLPSTSTDAPGIKFEDFVDIVHISRKAR